MKAVAYHVPGAIERDDALLDIEMPAPTPGPRDLLVEVRAISVNPVDTKVRRNATPAAGEAKVLGWDAAGVVHAVGSEVTLFKPGERVWYAGSIARAGANSELHVVDERIVGRMPTSLDFAEAAAMPLTAITAWELLFDRLGVARGGGDGQSLLVVGAAGGVGSILVQLARRLTRLHVIGSASRAETVAWIESLGAHAVVDHARPLAAEVARLGAPPVAFIASLTHTDAHFAQLAEILAPQGRIGLIDDPATPPDIGLLKRKAASLHWEFMFTRPVFETADMIEQHRLLDAVAGFVDEGVLRSTLGEHYGTINAANLKRAHAHIESGRAKGKIVLEGF
jgi:zinc-binding alcohol dehydrogenase family protein